MKREQSSLPMNLHLMQIPTPAQADDAIRACQSMYRKTLIGWASDALVMRHRGLQQFTWRSGMRTSGWSQAA